MAEANPNQSVRKVVLPEETWKQIIDEVADMQVPTEEEDPFAVFKLGSPREQQMRDNVPDLKTLRLVSKTFAYLAGERLFRKFVVKALTLSSEPVSLQLKELGRSTYAAYVNTIIVDSAVDSEALEDYVEGPTNPTRRTPESVMLQINESIMGLARVFNETGPCFPNIRTVEAAGGSHEYYSRVSYAIQRGREAAHDVLVSEIVKALHDRNLENLQTSLPAFRAILEAPTATAKLACVQRLKLEYRYWNASCLTQANGIDISRCMPALTTLILEESQELDDAVVENIKGLSTLHLESGGASISKVHTLLVNNASTLGQISMHSTELDRSEMEVQRSFRDVDLPNLVSVDLHVTIGYQWNGRIPMATFSWSLERDGRDKLTQWISSDDWVGWDDVWSDS